MKKFVLILSIIAFAISAIAQQAPPNQMPPQKDQKMKAKESVQMKDGKVWYTKDGKSTIVNTEITLGGTKVKSDGSVVMKSGSTTSLKEGDYINSDGSITRALLDKKDEAYPK